MFVKTFFSIFYLVKRITQRDLLQWESNPHDFLSRCFSRTMCIPFHDVTLQTASLLNNNLFMERIYRTDLLQ